MKPRPLVRDRVLLPLLGVLFVGALWEATVQLYQLPVVVLPAPFAVARALGVSLYEFAMGYAVGVAVGVTLGIAMGESRLFRMAASPVIEALRFVVPFAWIPLVVLWFGTSYTGKILLVP